MTSIQENKNVKKISMVKHHFQNNARAHNHDMHSRLCDFLSILN